MSTHTNGSRSFDKRFQSGQKRRGVSRQISSSYKTIVSRYDAYTYALRALYLSHLLQPKARRLQHTPAKPLPPPPKQSSSVIDLVKDVSGARDTKSARLPKDFIAELDKRMTGILVGKEKMPEFGDAAVKRTFAVFLNEFKKPEFRKSVEKDRRVEDMLLIFFSNATKELSRNKTPDDDAWKLMVDRHVALFVRLISNILKANGWAADRPELASRLQTLESKLLVHDQDLAAQSQRNGGAGGISQEVEVPRSRDVKDMPFVHILAHIFDKPLPSAQIEINEQSDLWTEQAALEDLKRYQTLLSLNSKRTIRSEDFDTEEAYEMWKKTELPELSQMILTILQSDPKLAKTSLNGLPQYTSGNDSAGEQDYGDLLRQMNSITSSSAVFDQPVDMSTLSLNGHNNEANGLDDGVPYMFIPPEPREYYRCLVRETLMYDLRQSANQENYGATEEGSPPSLLSKKSAEMLNEIGMRWRLPYVSRMMLLLDVVREKFAYQEIDCSILEAAFNYLKEPPQEKKFVNIAMLADRTKWIVADFVLNQQILVAIHDTLLRTLFEELQTCYGAKPPDIGALMAILENHIYDDPLFSRTADDLDEFALHLTEALRKKAMEAYSQIYNKQIPQDQETVEFYHVIQLGKAVLNFAERIQKRYRKAPAIMGVEPFIILVEIVLPACVTSIGEQIQLVLMNAQTKDLEIPIEDGFEIYREMVDIRKLHAQALPDVPFAFQIEGMLATFVWRWIALTDKNMLGWVENAVKQDEFQVRTSDPNQAPNDDERHSVSIIDIFRSFNQSIFEIIQLDWDDKLQYAKFMTALSKAIGSGLQRYCELLEQLFVKEMDRLSPEQEANLNQTRQERWLKMAKDAVSTKEKMEPFQFFPESFVKLNNIAYAMLQLDKIENEINVDACAEIIQKKEPPPPPLPLRQRKAEKFVFTVKIVEAEDLRPMDTNGSSDPYVVLGDEYQKRLAKTRIIYNTLNPRWDESVDISTTGPVNITATIWDWDILGDHDCEGRTTLKLDPSHFRDFLPREYWLDLDTQGRLLVRVSMEGEKDDIQFCFGKTFRNLKRTERDMTRKITDKLSAYIHYSLSRRALRNLTKQQITMSSVSSYFQRNRLPQPTIGPSEVDIANALKPLFTYFNENFAIMQQTLTSASMVAVMTRVWKEVLATVEALLVPPLSDKPSNQKPLSEAELDIVFKWLQMLFDFFHAVDEETGDAQGVPVDILKSPRYHGLKDLHFFYYEPTDHLIRTSERMATASADRQRDLQASRLNRLSAPPTFGGSPAGLLNTTSIRRAKSIMLSRNLGTMRKAKEEKRKEAQAEPSDDMILRILRMRPEAAKYLKDRTRQRERLAAAAAAEMIVRQSLAAEARKGAASGGGVSGVAGRR